MLLNLFNPNELRFTSELSKSAYKNFVRCYRMNRNLLLTGMEFDSDNANDYYTALFEIESQFKSNNFIPQGFDKYHPDNDFLWLMERAKKHPHISSKRISEICSFFQYMSNYDAYLLEEKEKTINHQFYKRMIGL